MNIAEENKKLSDLDQYKERAASDPNVWGMFIHLSQFFLYLLPLPGLAVPFILWQTKKKKSDIIDQHGRIVANWIFTELLICMVIILLSVFGIVGPLIIALVIVSIVFSIIGAVKAKKGEFWNYPCSVKIFPLRKGKTMLSGTVNITPLDRIRSISELVRAGCILLMVLLTSVMISSFFTMFIDTHLKTNVYVAGHGYTSIYLMSSSGKIIFTITILLGYGIILKILYHLQKLFRCYSTGKIFTVEVNKQIRQIGFTVCLLPFMIYTLYWANDAAVYYSFGVGNIDITAPPLETIMNYFRILIAGVSVICISWIMDAGIRIREDQDLII